MAENINSAVITGNLTRDPELIDTKGDTTLVNMRVAVNSRVKRSGEWEDKPNYFNVLVFGAQGENCKKFLSKGSPVGVSGRLDWSEWTKDDVRREQVQIIANSVQFLSSGDGSGQRDGGDGSSAAEEGAPATSAPAGEDDIPF